MEEVDSTRLTSLERVTTGVGSVSRAAHIEADSHGRLLRPTLPDDVVSLTDVQVHVYGREVFLTLRSSVRDRSRRVSDNYRLRSVFCYGVGRSLQSFVFPIELVDQNHIRLQNAVTLKTGLGVRQGHCKCHCSIERI